jgi:hypothetical protein
MVRRLFLIVLLTMLFGVGVRISRAAGVSMSGHLSAAAHEIDEGYFSIGPENYIIAKPGSAMHEWLKANVGQDVTVSVSVLEPTE